MRGHANRRGIVRDVRQNHSIRADADVIADTDLAENHGADAEFYIVPNSGRVVVAVPSANANIVPKSTVAPNVCTGADHDSAKMINA